jgi:diacylglycerol kinase (ATP)
MKPKYSLKKNFGYSIDGLKELLKETAFRIELSFVLFFTIVLFFLPYPLWSKIFLFASLLLPIIAETFNTSIEKVVDLVHNDYHLLAKHAKDISAFAVLVSIIFTFLIWLGFIVYFWDKY